MSLIDKYQSNYLINNVNKESYMDNYYKTSKNIGNILNSYEFQRQFVKSKRKYKFMKKIRQKKLSLEKSSSGFNTLTSNDTNKNIIETKLNTDNEIKSQAKKSLTYTYHLKINMSTIKEEETPNNNDYDISTILAKNKPKREKTSQYMRQTLFQQIKNEGLYSVTVCKLLLLIFTHSDIIFLKDISSTIWFIYDNLHLLISLWKTSITPLLCGCLGDENICLILLDSIKFLL